MARTTIIAGVFVARIFSTMSCGAADEPAAYPAVKGERATRPAFDIDSTKAFRIELGRGGGFDGLDTVKLDRSGKVIMHRVKWEQRQTRHRKFRIRVWETVSLRVSEEDVAKILEAIKAKELMNLDRAYHADVADGTQWVFRIEQGGREKSVYFNNHFPASIIQFAKKLDAIIAESGVNELAWKAVPEDEHGQHDNALWESISR